MVYKATEEVVQRVMPLLERLSERTIDKARLLQYLSARAGIVWGVFELTGIEEGLDREGRPVPVLQLRDRATGGEMTIEYPACLPPWLDQLVQDEYRRLAADRPLTLMAEPLFQALFAADYCARCRWQGADYAQIHRECRYAGHPVNFEPVS
jgi:hypothetical protein